MRKRHRIKQVYLWQNRKGFSLLTKNGVASILIWRRDKPTKLSLQRHIPHIIEELIRHSNDLTPLNLTNLLVGRYLYGKAVDVEVDGMMTRRIM